MRERRDVEDEIRFHLEMRARELEREGLDPDEARARAREEFGDVTAARRELEERARARERRGRPAAGLRLLLGDVKVALRSFRRRPGVPLVVVLTLGVGIGATTAIYSLVDALVFRPLPFEEGERLVRMRDATQRPGEAEPWLYNTSPRSYHVLLESGILEGVTAQRYHLFNLTGEGEPMSVVGIGVSDGWLSTLRVDPVLGRSFTPREHRAGPDAGVVVLGHELWQSRFGGSPDVLGQSITLNDRPHTVVGVMPPRFNYPYGARLWVPDRFDPANANPSPNVAGRLRTGETLESTQRALDDLSRRAAERYPDSHAAVRFLAVPQREDLLGNQPRLGIILLGAVGFLLLIACANVANLLLVRSVSRRRDLALRTALGAGRADHVRLLLVESLLLAGAGGALGLLLASTLLDPLAALSVAPDSSLGAFFTHLRLDGRVLVFTMLATVGTGLGFGTAPLLQATRTEPAEALRHGERAASASGGGIRRGLVVGEVALAVVLMSGAGLLVSDFVQLRAQDPGYRTGNRWVASLVLPDSRFGDPEAVLAFLDRVSERVEALPGVETVGHTSHLPVTDGSTTRPVVVEDGPASETGRLVLVNLRGVDHDYLDAMGMTLVRGRSFTETEVREAADVMVVNEAAARAYWGEANPLGRRARFGTVAEDAPWREVVGVVADVQEEWELRETWYVPHPRAPGDRAYLVVRTGGPVTGLPGQLRRAVWAVEPDQPVERVAALTTLVDEVFASERLGAGMVAAFGGAGLLLAVLGVYGVVSHTVGRRRREMGIRRALGAGAGAVERLVLREGGLLVGSGLVLGTAGSLVLGPVLARFMAGNVPGRADMRMLAEGVGAGPELQMVVVVALGLAGMTACWVPAWRAARVDPAAVLREE